MRRSTERIRRAPRNLNGWDKVTFASFRPDLSENPDGDAEFMLLRDGEVVYQFLGYNQENTVISQPFRDVLAVAFQDVDGDGGNDILVTNEYGTDTENAYSSVRVYSQQAGEKGFVLDKFEPPLDEYLEKTIIMTI